MTTNEKGKKEKAEQAIAASALGGWLLDLGHGSTVPYFAVLTVSAALVSACAFIVDRHVPPARKARAALA